jgi:hypothetical protein
MLPGRLYELLETLQYYHVGICINLNTETRQDWRVCTEIQKSDPEHFVNPVGSNSLVQAIDIANIGHSIARLLLLIGHIRDKISKWIPKKEMLRSSQCFC